MGLLDGKVAVVTGAGQGIGRQEALALAKEGARVVVNDLGVDRHGFGMSSEAANKVVEEIKAEGGEAIPDYNDISTEEGANNLIWTALNKFKRVDILVNNAGILRDRTMIKMDVKDFDKVVAVHLRGTWLCSRAAARAMKLLGNGGRIINTTSIAGLIGNFGQSNYGPAKAGIAGLTRVISQELQKDRITVNAIAPIALTRMTKDLPHLQGLSEEDMGPQHIAPVVVFLASDLAKDINGMIIGVEGRRVYLYKTIRGQGVTLDSGMWTPQMLHERWSEIVSN